MVHCYLPITINALNKELKDEKGVTKEHLFPRKRAGKDVLTNSYTLEQFFKKVKEEYRIFMYLTSEENKSTINYEGTHDEELERLNIRKFPVSELNLFYKNHTFVNKFTSWAKPRVSKRQDILVDDAEELLKEFLQTTKKQGE